jgi:cell division protein FtsQ
LAVWLRIYAVVGIAAALVLLGIGTWLFRWPGFAVSHIDVVGNDVVSSDEIIARARIEPGQNVWLLNLANVQRRIEAVPYVAHASVARRFPSGVTVLITERAPDGCIVAGRTLNFTIDTESRVLALGCSSELPRFDVALSVRPHPGDFVTDVRLRRLQADVHLLADPHRFAYFDFDRFGGFEATLSNGIVVSFGADDRLREKEDLITPILQTQGHPLSDVKELDLRVSAVPVVVYRTLKEIPLRFQDSEGSSHNM